MNPDWMMIHRQRLHIEVFEEKLHSCDQKHLYITYLNVAEKHYLFGEHVVWGIKRFEFNLYGKRVFPTSILRLEKQIQQTIQ